MAVYFIQAGESGPVKIGYARDVASRLIVLQCCNHEQLRVLRIMQGDRDTERALHKHYASQRHRAEWFRYSEDMLSVQVQPVKAIEQRVLYPEHVALLEKVQAHLFKTNMSATEFGRRAVNNGKFVGRLRAGANMTFRTIDKVESFIAAAQAAA